MKQPVVTMIKPVLTLAASVLVLSSACGTRSYIEAETSKYPISMSSGVRDETGKLVPADRLQKVGTFKQDYRTCSMIWTLIPLWNRTRDISDAVNEQVSQREGEAVINLTVEAGAHLTSVMTIVGLLPDCNFVKVRGDIVERIAQATPPAVMPAPPPVAAPPAPAATPPPAAAATAPAPAVAPVTAGTP